MWLTLFVLFTFVFDVDIPIEMELLINEYNILIKGNLFSFLQLFLNFLF